MEKLPELKLALHKQVDESIKYLKDYLLDILSQSKLQEGQVVTSNRG